MQKILSALAILFFFGGVLSAAEAADGSGANSVSPSSVTAASTGNTLTFTFTAAENMDSGGISIAVPSDWSAPQGTAGVAGYTAITTAGTIADVKDNMDSVAGWSAGTACSSGLSADTGVKQEGMASLKCANGIESNGDAYYKNITTENWTDYTKISFWIRTSAAVTPGRIFFAYDDSANLASPVRSLNVGVLPANTWTYKTFTLTSPRTSIVSYGFNIEHASELTDLIIYADDILIGPGSPTFSGSGAINARFLTFATGATTTVAYGSGGGASGATAPSTAGTYTFTTQSRASDSGTLTDIASSPAVTVGITPSSAAGPGVRPTTIIFSGKAFPDAKVTIIDKDVLFETPLKQDVVSDKDGKFYVSFAGILQSQHLFGLAVKDSENRSSQTKFFSIDTVSNSLTEKDIIISPTIDFINSAITRGKNAVVVGYAAPGNAVKIEIDGKIKGEAKAGEDGGYRLEISTGELEFGSHSGRVKQVDKDEGKESDFSLARSFVVSRLPSIVADFNGDDRIDIKDWSIFLSRWLSKEQEIQNEIDLNRDGKINIFDFSIFIRNLRKK